MAAYLELVKLLRELLERLEKESPKEPDPDGEPQAVPFHRLRFRIMRAQYNRGLFPEQYTPNNPHGLYSGKDLEAIRRGARAFNRESNVWLDLTAFREDGTELHAEDIKRAGLAYRTAFRINDGSIVGYGTNERGLPADWTRENPTGANISEENWRQSLGFTVRVHVSEPQTYSCEASLVGIDAEPLTFDVK